MTATADLTGYSSPLSLWKLVEQHVERYEHDEIKSMLGVGLVDETLELHEELSTLLDIWRDCRNGCTKLTCRPEHLPEPPGVRERLIQEIKFFVENVREKAHEQGRDEAAVLNKYNHEVIDYAINGYSRAGSAESRRPVSVMGRDGRETPSVYIGTPTSDRLSSSSRSTLSEDVDAMSDKLNILKLDEIMQHLRSVLNEEMDALKQDLKFLQECIEEEADAKPQNQQVMPEEPTLTELREERLKLEKDMLSEAFVKHKPVNNVLQRTITRPKTRVTVIPSHGPMKAVHTQALEGIVLEGPVPESVVHKAQQRLSQIEHTGDSHDDTVNIPLKIIKEMDTVAAPRLIKLGTISTHQLAGNLVAQPPQTPIRRSSSALKFRTMVMSARSPTEN